MMSLIIVILLLLLLFLFVFTDSEDKVQLINKITIKLKSYLDLVRTYSGPSIDLTLMNYEK